MGDKETSFQWSGTAANPVVLSSPATLCVHSVKAIAESVGVSNLPNDVATEIAEEVTFTLKSMVHDAKKFMENGRRVKLNTQDIDHALNVGKTEIICSLGDLDAPPIPFARRSDGKIHLLNEAPETVDSSVPLISEDFRLRADWLATEKVKSSIQKNPTFQSKDEQTNGNTEHSNKDNECAKKGQFTTVTGKPFSFKTSEYVLVKLPAPHELSLEQQVYYQDLMEACVGSDEKRRSEALQCLCDDTGLCDILPSLCKFIAEGVQVNVGRYNMAILIYLMRMDNSLLDNQTATLEKYLHEIIPSIVTCLVCEQLCDYPELGNHWVLRDYASRLMSRVCKKYTNSINNIQPRLTKLFSSALENDEIPLACVYGAIAGLGELGIEVITAFIIPKLSDIGTRVEFSFTGKESTPANKISAQKIKDLISKLVCPVLKSIRKSPDVVDEYNSEFGYLGSTLHMGVLDLRNQDQLSSVQT